MILALLLALFSPAPIQDFGPQHPLPGDLEVGPTAGNQNQPAAAAGPGHHLVVWEDDGSSLVDSVFGQLASGSSAPGNRDIHGMLFDDGGVPLLPAPIVIAREPWDQIRPSVAWNGAEYLVVFETTRPTPNFYSAGIAAVRVSGTGQVLDPVPLVVHDSAAYEEYAPAVASAGGDWLVVWSGHNSASGVPILQGRTIASSGTQGSLRTLVPGSAGFATSYDIATSGGMFAIAFSVSYGQGMRARLFDSSGFPAGPVVTLQTGAGNHPAIAAGPAGFHAAWNGAGLRGTTLDLAGNVGSPGGALLVAPPLSVYAELDSAWDGSVYRVCYDDGNEVRAVTLDVGGTLLGAPIVLSASSGSLGQVAVVSSPGRTHVFWSDTRVSSGAFGPQPDDVWSTSISSDGILTAAVPVSVSVPAQFDARIAGDAESGFLVVFQSWRADRVQVLAQAIDAQGNALSAAPFALTEALDRILYDPDIAWNGSEFLVTWTRLQSIYSNGPPPLIEARRCRLDGTLLDATPFTVMEGRGAAVDAVGGTFLVGAPFQHPILQQNSAIRARRVDGATGALLDGAPIYIDGSSGFVDVVGLSDRWFVAFSGVRLAILDSAGTVVDQFYAADNNSIGSSILRLAANPARDEALLTYEARNASNLVVYSDIRMKRFALDGSSPDPFLGPLVTDAFNAQLRPACASLGDESLFAWADHRDHPLIEPGLGDVFAGRVSFDGAPLDAQGIPVLDGAGPEGSVDLHATGGGGALLAASSIDREGLRSAVHRVRIGRYAGPSLGSVSCTQPNPNSSGGLGRLELLGSTSVADRDLTLCAHSLPPNSIGMFIVSRQAGNLPGLGGGLGTLCLGAPIGRYSGPGQIQTSGATGSFELTVDPTLTPTPAGLISVLAGETWFYQAWHRDVVSGNGTSNLTEARSLLFR